MKFKFSVFFFLLIARFSLAQNGLVNQYHFNYLALNPALAGENGPFAIKGMMGNQFNGSIRFNQVNQVLVLDGQLYNKAGLAFQGYRSNVGNIISTGLGISYSKGIEIGDLQLKAGTNAGIFIQPNIISIQINQQVSPYAGLGVFAHYKGVFFGLSNPMLFASKRIYEQKPFYANLGYMYDKESLITFNANTLFYHDLNSNKSNLDFNLKMFFNKRLALGASFRNNKIYTFYDKEKVIVPFIDYKITTSTTFGLSYNSNTVSLGNTGPSSLKTNGVFQFMIKYCNDNTGGDAWFYNKF